MPDDIAQPGSSHVENSPDAIPGVPRNPIEYAALERQLVRKVDWRLMPVLVLMIVLNYLDRNALPNARVQGIETDLGLKGDDYNVAISVLFAGYIALQIPSNMLPTRVRPSIYLPFCMALWGIVKDFRGLVICRFSLGFLEAPFFPGALFLLSSWYTPKELATRTAVLYTGSLLSGGFGGLVGAGVQYGLNNVHGLLSWKRLFILKGIITVGVSLLSIFILVDFPSTTRGLADQERAIAIHRLHRHSGTVDEAKGPILQGIKMAIVDYKVWLLTAIIITKTSAGAVTSFIPTLVATFKFSAVQWLLMVAPPYVFAAMVALAISMSSDKHSERYFHLVTPLVAGLAGYTIAATSTALAPRYFSLFLMLGGVYGSYDISLAWMDFLAIPRPLEKRAAAFAIANMVGNFAQIYSPYMYNANTGPRYLAAMVANSVFVFASICVATVLRFCLVWENQRLEAAEMAGREAEPDSKPGDVVQRGPGGVVRLRSGFRYTL
ncbi:MFS transporter [Aspergillus heteromorphus CBS 117.55]|uniref:MFS transporter n=1 Tax=Aspergillus heteromorphus CBS 117.55 TaxID=1448321 RepID=A0A317W8H4_9EURO|nr:MFS transporter [Aspergillus heteromorphus CBS 117.55]PWY82926.1 MFS transporter [Aspergillus heteromorphus CBS 117.55]